MENLKNRYVVIMAGGVGSRFWPVSRNSFPKQFIDIFGTGQSLLQMTYNRVSNICKTEHILVVTHHSYFDLVHQQLPRISANQILCEPHRKNTAPCVAYAAFKIYEQNPDAEMLIVPADHLILDEIEFCNNINQCFDYLNDHDEALLTLGIRPSRADTGYGYIQYAQEKGSHFFPVDRFVEKPDIIKAREYLIAGNFLWNSGMFIWKCNTIINNFKYHTPALFHLFETQRGLLNTADETVAVASIYANCESDSIDYAIMEKAQSVIVFPAAFGWTDLGTWGSLYEQSTKDEHLNVTIGSNILTYNSAGNLINNTSDKIVVIEGLQNCIVIETDHALLICNKDEEQRIKGFVADVEKRFGKEEV